MRRRLDSVLVERGLAATRSEAARMIDDRVVRVSGAIAEKTSRLVGNDEPIEIVSPRRYVSRGGDKLAGGLASFGIDVRGLSVIDVGSSTGGFTDCLLQQGAARVFAVDVGKNQLHERIAGDERVTWVEGTNIRDLGRSDLPFPCSLLVADLSFISLVTVLAVLSDLLEDAAQMVLLVKPQFEVGKEEASRGRGVITDPALHAWSVEKVSAEAIRLGWTVVGSVESPIKGGEGNTEFLLHLKRTGRP